MTYGQTNGRLIIILLRLTGGTCVNQGRDKLTPIKTKSRVRSRYGRGAPAAQCTDLDNLNKINVL